MYGWCLDGYWFDPVWDAEDTRTLISRWIEEGRRAAFTNNQVGESE